MQPLKFDGVKSILYPCHDLLAGIKENTCFGITKSGNRCKRSLELQKSRERHKELSHSLAKLVQLATAHDEDEGDNLTSEVFFVNLRNFIGLLHCHQHQLGPETAVAEWQKRVNAAHRDQEQSQEQSQEQDEDCEDDDDDTASTVSSSSNVSLLGDTPRHSRTVTPSTTPQTGRFTHFTIPAKSTHSAESGTNLAPELLADDDPTPPATPTPGERLLRPTSGMRLGSSSGTASGTRLNFGQEKLQKQQKQQTSIPTRPSIQDERREPLAKLSVSAANDPSPDAITADKSETLEANDEDIVATPQLLEAAMPLHAVDMHASSKNNGSQNDKDCYIGTDYRHIIETMQSGHAHNTKNIGRLYVLRDPNRSGLLKIGFSEEKEIEKRWQSTPCSKVAVPVFVSKDMFPGAFKAEALVKASLRHRRMTNSCALCNKYHTEWFWVEQDVILAWVHAWTAYVQSDIYNSAGYPTGEYHEFANRLLRITPARIHAKLAADPSSEPHLDPEETLANSPTTDVHGGSGSGSGGNGTKEAPLQPKPTPMVAVATSMQRLVRRAMTWDSGNSSSLNERGEKKGKEFTVVVQEVGEPEDADGMDGRGRNLRQIQKASQVASRVTSQIQLGISGMVNRGGRSSKRS